MNLGQREGEFFDRLFAARAPVAAVRAIQPQGQGDWTDFAMRLFGDVAGTRVLDLGCGQGYCTAKLALSGAAVMAIDASRVAVDRTIAVAQSVGCGDRVDARQMTVDELGALDPGSFDHVFGSLVLHHLPDMAGTGALCARLVKPGGKAIFCENSNRNPFARWGRRRLHGRLGFRREGTDDERQLSAEDIALFGSAWSTTKVHYPQFHFFQELSRTGMFKHPALKATFKRADRFVQAWIPPLRPYSIVQVVEFTKAQRQPSPSTRR